MSAPVQPAGRCRSCQAEVDWARTPDGKTMPLDRASAGSLDGNLAVRRLEDGTLAARPLVLGEEPGPGEKRGISHFASCQDAAKWRKREGAR